MIIYIYGNIEEAKKYEKNCLLYFNCSSVINKEQLKQEVNDEKRKLMFIEEKPSNEQLLAVEGYPYDWNGIQHVLTKVIV